MEGFFFVSRKHPFLFMQCETNRFCFKSLILIHMFVLYIKCWLITVNCFLCVYSFVVQNCCLLDDFR